MKENSAIREGTFKILFIILSILLIIPSLKYFLKNGTILN